jgi:hypothetical protein
MEAKPLSYVRKLDGSTALGFAELADSRQMLTADSLEQRSAQGYHWCREQAPLLKAHHSADASPQN